MYVLEVNKYEKLIEANVFLMLDADLVSNKNEGEQLNHQSNCYKNQTRANF